MDNDTMTWFWCAVLFLVMLGTAALIPPADVVEKRILGFLGVVAFGGVVYCLFGLAFLV